MNSEWLVIVRALHILAAALWIGAAAMLTFYILPALRHTGTAGTTVLVEAMRRGVGVFMPSVGGVTVLSGLVLYWNWHAAHGGLHGTGAAMLTFGGLAGIAAAIISGAVIGRTVNELTELAIAPADDTTGARVAALHARGAIASRIAITLLVAAMLLMVFARAF